MSDDHFKLDDVVLIGRTFAEYHRLFALDNANADDVILDVGAGVSSFCAEANARGYRVTASDRIYGLAAEAIAAQCVRDLDQVMAQLPAVAHRYVWDTFPDIAALRAEREKAYQTFIADYRVHGQQRYVPTTYPHTTFADNQFSLTLVSHFLFLYDDQIDYAFHQATLRELVRITTREIRLFPLVNLRYDRSRFVDRLMVDPAFAACTFNVVTVDYEFMRGGNEMLVMSLRSS
jgi:hypothetical protein